MSGIASKLEITYIAADAVEHGMRNVLTGKPHQMLRDINLNGSAVFSGFNRQAGNRKLFSNRGSESELTLQTIIGMLDYYRRNNESIGFEGAVFTPLLVKNLKVPGFVIKAAFVGFTNLAHADQIIRYAKSNPHDWVNDWLKIDGEEEVIAWVAKQAKKCADLKSEAKKLGYPFFDISTMQFEQYVETAQRHFLT